MERLLFVHLCVLNSCIMKKKYLLPLIILFFGFNGLIKSATFTSVSSGTWSAPATWSVTGIDADGIPDLDDDVTINAGHNIILINLQNNFASLVISNGANLNLNSKALNAYGDFTINGTVSGNYYYFRVFSPTILTSTPTFTNKGNWHIYSNLTIAPGTNVSIGERIEVYSSATVTNLGLVNIGASSVRLRNSSSIWINGANSSLQVNSPLLGFTDNFNFSATNNTFVCLTNCTAIPSLTYFNLSISGTSTKIAQGNLNVLNNYTSINNSSANILNLNGFDMFIGGNWNNQVNQNVQNQGTITFNGSGIQNINRSGIESFSNLVINSTGTVNINSYLNVSQNLTVNSGELSINVTLPQSTLRIQGNLVNNGTINCNNRSILFNGVSLQSISGSSNTQFHEIILSNSAGIIINSPQSLTGVLTLSSGNFNSNGFFTLISNATTTARIAPRGGGNPSVSGTMIIQKFISARPKGWHDLSSPVQNTTIFDWDDEMYMSGIGGDDGTPGPAGVDGFSGTFKSVLTYNEPIADYDPVVGSSTPLVSGRGYEIWFADDMTNWFDKTIDTRGVPTFGNILINNLSYTPNAGGYGGLYDGLNLIGNPFASAVNYSACTKTNLVSGVLILDNSGNYNDYGPNAVIPPHQGIWVQASAPGASINFLENAKSTSNTTNFYRTAPDYGVKLVFSSPQLSFYNENTVNFLSSATSGFDKEYDAVYLKSPNKDAPAMYMAIGERGGLITNAVSPDEEEVTIPLSLFTPSTGIYYIEPSVINTAAYSKAWIEHVKTGKKYDLKDGSIAIEGNENETNKDYVLRFSKSSENNTISQAAFENDLVVFNIENALILKANSSNHLITSLSIYDLSGKKIMDHSNISVVVGSTMEFDISNLAKGLYIVNAIDSNNHLITKKIVK